jgi:hypothetical protein
MITEDQARAICHEEINRDNCGEQVEMVVTDVIEHPEAWVAYYQSRAYMESGNVGDALAGNGPFVISKTTGRFVALGTALPFEKQIDEAIKRLRNL